MKDKIGDLESMKSDFESKNTEIFDLNKKLLKLQDEKLDIEASMENREGKEHTLKEEIVILQDVVKGKDTAIQQLSRDVLNTTNENSRLSDMVQQFKNQLILGNCFKQQFGCKKVSGSDQIKNGSEITIGFIRDTEDEEEFYLEIISKNEKNGERETIKIPVDDIDEIEHVEGTL